MPHALKHPPPHLQGQAEGYLEHLHKMVETDLNKFIDMETAAEEWPKFREGLIGMTDVTRIHFAKLVAELEKGLDAMLADYHVGAPPCRVVVFGGRGALGWCPT